MKQSSKRLISSLLGIVFLAGSFVVFTNMILPTMSEIDKIRAQEAAREDFVSVQKNVIEKMNQTLQNMTSDEQAVVQTALPSDPDMASSVSELSALLQASGLLPQAFSVSAPALQVSQNASSSSVLKPVGGYTVQARFMGTYENFRTFLGRLEHSLRLFDIRTLSVTPGGKPADNVYTFDMGVGTYYQTN